MPDTVTVLSLASAALLVAAAWRDLATRIIPNGVCLGLAALGVASRAPAGAAAVAASLGAATALFLLLAWLHARGALGGGDVKLAAAVALGLPPAATIDLVLATSLAGMLLAFGYLALGRLPFAPLAPAGAAASLPRRVLPVEWRRIRRRGPLPYGVAIAIGGILVSF